jgi:hypothetical protein
MMTLEEVHAVLDQAYQLLASLYQQLPDEIGSDTAFATGESIGVLAKAKALIGRDIDQALERKRNEPV